MSPKGEKLLLVVQNESSPGLDEPVDGLGGRLDRLPRDLQGGPRVSGGPRGGALRRVDGDRRGPGVRVREGREPAGAGGEEGGGARARGRKVPGAGQPRSPRAGCGPVVGRRGGARGGDRGGAAGRPVRRAGA